MMKIMVDAHRGPKPNDKAVEQLDGPGRWWFSGLIRVNSPEILGDTSWFDIPVRMPRLFDVAQKEDRLVIAEARDRLVYPLNCEWIGWWVKQEKELSKQ